MSLTRVPAAARAGEVSTKDALKRTLGKAFDQINRTHQAIRGGAPEFSAIPTDRPLFGLVTTLDHWYIANSGLTRNLLSEPEVPTLVASVGALEHLVAIGQRRAASTILAEILDDDERRTWDLTTALVGYTEAGDANPILRQAWEQYPFREESDESA